jgi:hypothetical protein
MVDMLVRWYPYSGDAESIKVVREMLDYQLAHGTTPADWEWANVPFATSCIGEKEYGRCLQDAPKEFYGGTETDKVGELGLGYVLFYELTGERKYLEAGLRCAEQLAKHIRPGDAAHTPWPFRIDARTGLVIGGAEYGGMIVAPVRLFEELVRLGVGDTAGFQKVRDMAWKWLLNYPLGEPFNKDSTAWDHWIGYYEDQPTFARNETDMTSMMTAYYILSQDDPARVDPNWRLHVSHLLDRSRLLLGRGPFFGAWGIDEQVRPEPNALLGTDSNGCCGTIGLSCRTSQWGAINAMFYQKTGDGKALEDAFRSLNYATYFARSDGQISCCGLDFPDSYWFEDSYADAGRSFAWALAAVPKFAPIGQDHLLRSSSIVQAVKYSARRVEYATFDKAGNEVLRLNFLPAKITAGSAALTKRDDLKSPGYTVQPVQGGDYVVSVYHADSNKVVIEGKP